MSAMFENGRRWMMTERLGGGPNVLADTFKSKIIKKEVCSLLHPLRYGTSRCAWLAIVSLKILLALFGWKATIQILATKYLSISVNHKELCINCVLNCWKWLWRIALYHPNNFYKKLNKKNCDIHLSQASRNATSLYIHNPYTFHINKNTKTSTHTYPFMFARCVSGRKEQKKRKWEDRKSLPFSLFFSHFLFLFKILLHFLDSFNQQNLIFFLRQSDCQTYVVRNFEIENV